MLGRRCRDAVVHVDACPEPHPLALPTLDSPGLGLLQVQQWGCVQGQRDLGLEIPGMGWPSQLPQDSPGVQMESFTP